MAKSKKTKRGIPREVKSTSSKGESKLQAYLDEIALDEEMLLANLVFDSVVAGRQLDELHFSASDFTGVDSNKTLLRVILSILDAGLTLNLANVMQTLTSENIGKKSKLELVGGEDRITQLFLSPFAKPNITLLDDLEPLVEKIRDRNVRHLAHQRMTLFSERVMNNSESAYDVLGTCIQELRGLFLEGSASYIKDMDKHVAEMSELIEINKKNKRDYLGYNTKFPILMEKLNGIQKELYLITGGVGMGKSTFATQLAWDLAVLNPELTVIYFSLDLNRIDVTAKMVAQTSEIPIDYVKNPRVTLEEFEEKRIQGLKTVSEMSKRLILIDESTGRLFLEDIKKIVKRTKLEMGSDVAVVIDPIFKIQIRNGHQYNFTEKCNYLSSELKSLAAIEGVPVITTAGLPKAISNRRPSREDLGELMGLLYDPYAVFFVYCDYLNDFDTPFLEWQWGDDSFMVPISEILVAKNKMGGINSQIFYRYYEAYSKYKECAPQEVENFTAMIENLEKFQEEAKNKKPNGRAGEF